ncbi:MAG: outer membrane beta-barrel family protein, partial [Cytophagales bacterium]|nr:outer membrane beta-barrel family protein [Cytophagales bacterium]
ATNPKYQYELQYKKDFKDHKEHDLILSATGDFFGKDKQSLFKTGEINAQKTQTDFAEAKYLFKIDYTHPFSEKFSMENGAQYKISNVTNDYSVSEFQNNLWINNASQTNVFNYLQAVLGAYATGAYEGEKWGIKAGVRLENTQLDTEMETTNEKNDQSYVDLFPSVHTSYKINKDLSLQAGYSSRINRPRLWNLNPFTSIRDNYNIRTGNPNLKPEYTDSYEVSGIYKHGGFNLSTSVYHRYTTDAVERVITYKNSVSISRPENAGTNKATGLELNTEYSPVNWLSLTGDFNYNHYKREGSWETTVNHKPEVSVFDFSSDYWKLRVKTKIKLPGNFDVEMSGRYRSEYQTIQTTLSSFYSANLGIRKKILKGKAVVNLNVRDLFASGKYEGVSSSENFRLYDYGKRGRFVILGFSYGFGKGEAMHFSGQKRF